MPRNTILFTGLGSAHGDDRAGWLVADMLAARQAPGWLVRRAAAPLDILDWLDGIDRLAICDACVGTGHPGKWRRWPWPVAGLPSLRTRSTHDLGLAAALQLGARLGRLPPEVLLWVVEIGQADPFQPVSREVQAAVEAVVDDVMQALAAGHSSQADMLAAESWCPHA
jgi:hydrogenase maturation protease